MGKMSFSLGLQVKQTKEEIYLSQMKYVKELLKKYNIDDKRSVTTPLNTNFKLCKDEFGKSADQKKYRGMIRSLLYLTTSKLDIQFAVCLYA